jgi:hypothetical protein
MIDDDYNEVFSILVLEIVIIDDDCNKVVPFFIFRNRDD